jgi:cytoskeleton protein RodZ
MTDLPNEPIMPPSPGALMKAGRERAGIHLAVLSSHLKVPVKQLASLEADDYSKMASPVFARALAAKVCRLVNIDSESVLALMPVNTNGLKPLVIIGEEQTAAYPSMQVRRGGSERRAFKFWWFALAICAIALMVSGEWIVTVLDLDGRSDNAAQVLPTMPPEELPVATDASQTELPKAMVFDESTSSQVVSPQALGQAIPAVSTPLSPSQNSVNFNVSPKPSK